MSSELDLGFFTSRKVKLSRQSEIAECGLACIAMVASYHGLDIGLETLRRHFAISSRGVSLKSLINIADRIGLMPRALKVEPAGLRFLSLPAVLHWNLNHFVVLEKVSPRRGFLIHNPDSGSRWLSTAEVSDHFTGVALELEPSGSFRAKDLRQRLHLTQLWSRLKDAKRAIAQVAILTVVMQAFVLSSPYYIQIALDGALPTLDHNLLVVLALGFCLFSLINGFALLLRSFVLLSIGASLGVGLSANLSRRLFRLPLDWFERRQVGDILSRFQSVVPIRNLLTEDIVVTTIDGVMAIMTLIFMALYSVLLSSIALAALCLYALLRILLYPAQQNAQEQSIISSAKEQTVLIESIRGMRTLRLFGGETLRHAIWQSKMTDAMNGAVRLQRVLNWQATANATIFSIENVLSIWIAVSLVMSGKFTVGMVVAFMAYKAQFLRSASNLVDKTATFRLIRLHLDRLSDIASAEEDISFTTNNHVHNPLSGRLELRNISYRYGMDDPLILHDVNLTVNAGESIAITGPSGSGKSTLVRILLGLTEPLSGEVLVDGLPLRIFGHQNFHRQVAGVLQDDLLFTGSIAENISMFDESPDMDRIEAAAGAASISEDIAAMPMGYETMVGDMGAALSGGQRQRVLLARALYRAPKLLVIDEGTSHLDTARERQVNEAIALLGITRIIVAHRKETIETADRVVVLQAGQLVSSLAAVQGVTRP
ncbi:MAG: peptidase domain-containing ABC transporter [Sphingomonas sp.]|jgi:ATP-binding cassette subfamily B protein RaxB|uniref:peptidase domain-containing ABC transporter n=1 Tax=Sphingomonas sp. TaxID=28214 RepID=UPI00356405D6